MEGLITRNRRDMEIERGSRIETKENTQYAVPVSSSWKTKVLISLFAFHDSFISCIYSTDNNDLFICIWYLPYLLKQFERGRTNDFSLLLQPQFSIYNQQITENQNVKFMKLQMISTKNYDLNSSTFHVTLLGLSYGRIFQWVLTFSKNFDLVEKTQNEITLQDISTKKIPSFYSIMNYFLVIEDSQMIIRDYLYEYINDFNPALEGVNSMSGKKEKPLKDIQLVITYQIVSEENLIILLCENGKIHVS